MSAQSSGQTPRSSTSSQPSASSSVLRKLRQRNDLDPLNGSHIPLVVGAEDGDRGGVQLREGRNTHGEETEDRQQRRQRPRTSGGFLLQSSLQLHAPEQDVNIPARVGDIAKGKRRAQDGEIVVSKRATGYLRANEGKSYRNEFESGSNIENQDTRSHTPTEKQSASRRSPAGIDDAVQPRSLLGQDTDPAAIVNLALSLSESRRRNVSGVTAFNSNDIIGGRRRISGSPQGFGLPYGTSGGSLRQHLQDQRRISRNISLRSNNGPSRKADGLPLGTRTEKRQFSASQSTERNVEDDAFNPSDATLARAEKARLALELGYEYRRLLRYLPPLPTSTQSMTRNREAYKAQSPGRVYNPLQYVRNRKVRFREKKPLNPESDGWKDVGRVRAWVDSVKDQSENGSSRNDGSFYLPPFEAVEDEPTVIDSTDSPSATQSKNISVPPSTRPKLDWIFAPSDLLADIYWLHQGQNIERIEERSWQRIHHTPLSHRPGQSGTSKGSPISPDSVKSVNSTRSETSPKQARHSAMNGNFDPYERGRLPRSRHQLASSIDEGHGSRFRRSRWSKKLLGSRSSSSSGQSDSSDQSRRHRSLRMHDAFDNAALEKHMMDIINKEAEESRLPRDTANGDGGGQNANLVAPTRQQEEASSKHDFTGSKPLGKMPQDITRQATSSQHNMDGHKRHRRLSSDNLLTAPTSPIIPGLAPSIAVDLSPPDSPQRQAPFSTTSPSKRPLASRFGSFRQDRSRSVSMQPKDDRNALKEPPSSRTRPGKDHRDSEAQPPIIKDQPPVPPDDPSAPPKKDSGSNMSRLRDPRHDRTAKHVSSSESRRRGFFKGGRIAELVGNEVSKVGDILWRKDATHHTSHLDFPTASIHNSDASDDGDYGTSIVESNPSDNLSRVTTNNSGIAVKPSNAASERQKYYMKNLPIFRSQTVDNDEASTLAGSVSGDDHITRQQRMMKERGRSFKFDRLAPPRIDMRSVSPSPSPVISRAQSQDPANNQSRGSSGSRSTKGARIADQRLNDMLGIPGRVGTGKVAPTGLAAFSSHGNREPDRRRPDIKRQWSISDRGIPAVDGTITKRDIARVRALLLSSGVKANEIARRHDEIPSKPSPFLQKLQHVVQGPVPLIPASQEIVFAARTLVTDIESTHHQLRDGAEKFSTNTVDQLHNQIKAIDDQVSYKLTPLVRAAADDADALSTELTTTHTLAVRQLNVSIDVILRRRRRRLRWITRGGWAMLEWTVLGVMWAVWFVVVIIRIIRGTINAVVGTVRWLLFL